MPFHGACALLAKTEISHVFLVAKLRFGADGRVDHVLLTEIDPQTNQLMSAEEVPVSEVVELIHSGHLVRPLFQAQRDCSSELRFDVVAFADGESIALNGETSSGLGMRDIRGMDSKQMSQASFAVAPSLHAYRSVNPTSGGGDRAG
jgi:hypothetical protein